MAENENEQVVDVTPTEQITNDTKAKTAAKPRTKKTTAPAAKATAAKKTTVKSAAPKTATKKTTTPKAAATEAIAAEATTPKKKAEQAPGTVEKLIKTGKKTGNIATNAGVIILGSTLQTTKKIAGIYAKAGKMALEIGKDLIEDTTKAVKRNQKTVVDTSVDAFKKTVEVIKDADLIENPLKKKK